MQFRPEKIRTIALLQLMLLLVLLLPGNNKLLADSFTERRSIVGLKLFRTLVAADLNIEQKIDSKGVIPIALIYAEDDQQANEFQKNLQQSFSSVNDIPTNIELHPVKKLSSDSTLKIAAIFIAQPLSEKELKAVIQYGIENKIIVFSPYEGEVEQGVLGGLSVQATVRPMINMQTLKQSQLSIKPFYLKVANHYE